MYTKYMAQQQTTSATSIRNTTSFRFAQLARSHRKLADSLLSEIGLHVGQEMLLNALWEGESLSQSELAERLGIKPATLTVSLRPLEKAGYVNRQRDPDDQRVIRVCGTSKCMALKDAVLEVWSRLEARTVGDLTADERATLDRLLRKVSNSLQTPV